MSDNQKRDDQASQPSFVVHLPQNTPIHYVNAWGTQLGQSEFTIRFGLNPVDDPDADIEPVVSLVLTHATLLRLVMNLNVAASVVQKLYGGTVPSLPDLSREKLEAAMNEVRGETEAFQAKTKHILQQVKEEQKGNAS